MADFSGNGSSKPVGSDEPMTSNRPWWAPLWGLVLILGVEVPRSLWHVFHEAYDDWRSRRDR
jgi:hypothetical protein